MKSFLGAVLILCAGCCCKSFVRPCERVPASGAFWMAEGVVPAATVGQVAPAFSAPVVMPDDTLGEFNSDTLAGSYAVLLFYPGDFTFVCPTELIAFDDHLDAFARRNCRVVALSTDSAYVHQAWKRVPVREGGVGPLRYPMLSDRAHRIAERFGVLDNDGTARRALFLLDPRGVIRYMLIHDPKVGRNVEEALRVLDAIQLVDEHPDVCPADWTPSDKPMSPTPKGLSEHMQSREK